MPEEEMAIAPETVVEGEVNGGATEHVVNGGKVAISFSQVKPHLVIQASKAAEAIAFYKTAFGAEEVSKVFHAKRKAEQEQPHVLHAHLKFGDAEILIIDETEDAGSTVRSPASLSGTSCILHMETFDLDAAFSRAISAGAKMSEEVADKPWGQRCGKVIDPYGFAWSLASPVELKAAAVDIAEEPVVEAGQAA